MTIQAKENTTYNIAGFQKLAAAILGTEPECVCPTVLDELMYCLETLPPRQKSVVTLRYALLNVTVKPVPYDFIARAFGMTADDIKELERLGLEKLRFHKGTLEKFIKNEAGE